MVSQVGSTVYGQGKALSEMQLIAAAVDIAVAIVRQVVVSFMLSWSSRLSRRALRGESTLHV
jgi:hypothetical protein